MELAFEEFVDRSGRGLMTTAALLTGERHAAEDLYQAALLATWRHWDRIHTSPAAFARRTLVTTYAGWGRRRWSSEHPSDDLPEPAPGPAADTARDLDLREALDRLPRRQRAVVVLRYFEDLTEAQVAELMGTSVGTVKSQTHKALRSLGIDPALSDRRTEERQALR